MKRQRKWRTERFRLNPKQACFYCARLLTLRTSTVDHVIPLAKGGIDRPRNYVLSCLDCNKSKGSRAPTPDELQRAETWRRDEEERRAAAAREARRWRGLYVGRYA